YAGSGGDFLAWLFRDAGLGLLVGKRTGGAAIGFWGIGPRTIDGAWIPAPNHAFYNLKGEWDIENHGVAPDIEVEFDPRSWQAGHDPQIEAAVEWVLGALEKHPVPKPRRPS